MNPIGRSDRQKEPSAGPSGSQQILIPRLPRHDRPSSKQPIPKERVQRACRSCHRRKIKCSGGIPQCDYCEKANRRCIYDSTRRDRLVTATALNDRLVSLLRDLSGRVTASDRSLIEVALQDSEDEEGSPYSSQPIDQAGSSTCKRESRSPSPQSSTYQPNLQDLTPPNTSSHRLALLLQEANSFNYKLDAPAALRPKGKGPAQESIAHHTEHGGGAGDHVYSISISDAHWAIDLGHRVRRPETPAGLSVSVRNVHYHFDEQEIQLPDPGNPFSLPDEISTRVLFQCYLATAERSFPFVSPGLEHEVLLYYHSLRHRQPVELPQTWYAMVNSVLAVGARFSRLVNTHWRQNQFDEQVYLSRAYQLLGFNETAIMLSKPDIPLTQTIGLLSFYFMASGHLDRAWIMIGTAVRFAISLGLHKHDNHAIVDHEQKRVVLQLWWSLYNMESLLCSLTGRPCMLHDKDITAPFPGSLLIEQVEQMSDEAPAMPFQDAQVRLAMLLRRALSRLYCEKREAQKWAAMHSTMTSLMTELDVWASEALPPHLQGSDTPPELERLQFLLKKKYYRLKILITRPSLLRIEQSSTTHPQRITAFDRAAAEVCIQTAQEVATLLPDQINLRTMYERGPWWTIVHNFMQASTILLISISLRTIFPSLIDASITSFHKLILWLHAMRDANDIAERAYRVLYRLVVSAKEDVWPELMDCFPEHMLVEQQQDSGYESLGGIGEVGVGVQPGEIFMGWPN